VEGLNCDTFTLTVSGTPVDWVGKVIRVNVRRARADVNSPVIFHA